MCKLHENDRVWCGWEVEKKKKEPTYHAGTFEFRQIVFTPKDWCVERFRQDIFEKIK